MTAEEKFRPRRTDRTLPPEEAERVLREAEYGTVSMIDPDGNEAYGVPVSFVFFDGAIWIHSAGAGRKFRVFSDGPRVHFSAAQNVRAAFTRWFTSFYESVMAAGRIVPVNDDREKLAALRELCRKYLPEHMNVADEHIARSFARTAVFKILPDRLSAKANRP